VLVDAGDAGTGQLDVAADGGPRQPDGTGRLEAIGRQQVAADEQPVARHGLGDVRRGRDPGTVQLEAAADLGAGQLDRPRRLEPVAQEHVATHPQAVGDHGGTLLVGGRHPGAVEGQLTLDDRPRQPDGPVRLEPVLQLHPAGDPQPVGEERAPGGDQRRPGHVDVAADGGAAQPNRARGPEAVAQEHPATDPQPVADERTAVRAGTGQAGAVEVEVPLDDRAGEHHGPGGRRAGQRQPAGVQQRGVDPVTESAVDRLDDRRGGAAQAKAGLDVARPQRERHPQVGVLEVERPVDHGADEVDALGVHRPGPARAQLVDDGRPHPAPFGHLAGEVAGGPHGAVADELGLGRPQVTPHGEGPVAHDARPDASRGRRRRFQRCDGRGCIPSPNSRRCIATTSTGAPISSPSSNGGQARRTCHTSTHALTREPNPAPAATAAGAPRPAGRPGPTWRPRPGTGRGPEPARPADPASPATPVGPVARPKRTSRSTAGPIAERRRPCACASSSARHSTRRYRPRPPAMDPQTSQASGPSDGSHACLLYSPPTSSPSSGPTHRSKTNDCRDGLRTAPGTRSRRPGTSRWPKLMPSTTTPPTCDMLFLS
jgi:hypothetical protein